MYKCDDTKFNCIITWLRLKKGTNILKLFSWKSVHILVFSITQNKFERRRKSFILSINGSNSITYFFNDSLPVCFTSFLLSASNDIITCHIHYCLKHITAIIPIWTYKLNISEYVTKGQL